MYKAYICGTQQARWLQADVDPQFIPTDRQASEGAGRQAMHSFCMRGRARSQQTKAQTLPSTLTEACREQLQEKQGARGIHAQRGQLPGLTSCSVS